MLLELCKGVHCVDLGESFQTHIYLQNLASIQPRTSPVKCARSRNAETYESSPTRSRRGRGGRDDDLPAPRGRGRVLGWLRGARVGPGGSEGARRLAKFRQNVARFRLYRHRFLQENTRFAAFFKIYKIIKLTFLKSGKTSAQCCSFSAVSAPIFATKYAFFGFHYFSKSTR